MLAACPANKDSTSLTIVDGDVEGAEHTDTITLEDYAGRAVRLKKPAQRIVALSPHIVENLFSAGAGDKIVAAVSYSDFPTRAQSIPRLGGYSNFSPESIVSLQPDLVVGWPSGDQNFEAIRGKLEALGIAVYADEPGVLNDIARSIRDFGRLAGTSQHAEEVASNFLAKLEALRRDYRDRQKVQVFYQIWNDPVQTLNSQHIVNDVLELCGGNNLFSSAALLAPTVNIEAILTMDPQTIVVSSDDASAQKWMNEWREWPSLRAVKYDALYAVPSDWLSRHTVRMALGASALCAHLDKARQKIYGVNAAD